MLYKCGRFGGRFYEFFYFGLVFYSGGVVNKIAVPLVFVYIRARNCDRYSRICDLTLLICD